MKSFFRRIYIMLKGIGYARAAAERARVGDRAGAVALMQEYEKCK